MEFNKSPEFRPTRSDNLETKSIYIILIKYYFSTLIFFSPFKFELFLSPPKPKIVQVWRPEQVHSGRWQRLLVDKWALVREWGREHFENLHFCEFVNFRPFCMKDSVHGHHHLKFANFYFYPRMVQKL